VSFILVPHQVTSTTATIWVGATDEKGVCNKSVQLVFTHKNESCTIELDKAAWRTWKSYDKNDPESYPPSDRLLHNWLEKSPSLVRTLDYQRVKVEQLVPRTRYSLKLCIQERNRVRGIEKYLREGQVTTLPAALPAAGNKPFTLFLGSCFYGPEDPDGMVGATYHHIPERMRPEVKILCGDQVYLDNPWRETTLKWYRGDQKPGTFRAMLFRKYLDNWKQVRGEDAGFRHLLANGANYFCSDDHEFWNNAPNVGGVGYINTRTRKQRKWWMGEARRLFRAFQSPSPLLPLEVPPLSIRVVDTRIYRDTTGECFMKRKDLGAVEQWVSGLKGPGVLVVGQPVLVEKRRGFFHSVLSNGLKEGVKETVGSYLDKDLPDYEQYEHLIRCLRSSKHSIVILTGDVHYGRIAHGELIPGSRAKLIEVISSPMQVVLDHKDDPTFGTYRPAPTKHFPGLESCRFAAERNHFVTVEFSAEDDGKVNMAVCSWPILRPGADVPSTYEKVFDTIL
jgi:hypothetical protein